MNPAIPIVATLAGLGATKAPRRKRKNNNGESQTEAQVASAQRRRKTVLEVQMGVVGRKKKRAPTKAEPKEEAPKGASKTFTSAFVGRRKKDEAEPGTTLLGKILNARHGPSPSRESTRVRTANGAGPARPPRPVPGPHVRASRAAEAAKLTGPDSLFARRIGGDIILSEDGQQGFVGARWWAETGRPLLDQVTAEGPLGSPEEAAVTLLSAARGDIDWGAEEAPEGVVGVRRRVAHYIQGSLSHQGEDAQAPQGATTAAPSTPAHQFGGATMGAAMAAREAAAAGAEAVEASDAASDTATKRKRRGSRGRKKDITSDATTEADVGGDALEVAADDNASAGE